MQTNETPQNTEAETSRPDPNLAELGTRTGEWYPHGAVLLLPTGLALAGPQSRFPGMAEQEGAVLIRQLRPAHWCDWLEANARAHADRIVPLPDAIAVPAGEVLRFARRVEDQGESVALVANWIDEAIGRAPRGQASILAGEVEAALADPDVRTAQMLCKLAGITYRQLAGLCDRAFGFTPNLLLRRARFLRSFAAIEHLPWGQWTGAIDPAYFDQSHFIRDCHRFLGTTPSRFLAGDAEQACDQEASSAA